MSVTAANVVIGVAAVVAAYLGGLREQPPIVPGPKPVADDVVRAVEAKLAKLAPIADCPKPVVCVEAACPEHALAWYHYGVLLVAAVVPGLLVGASCWCCLRRQSPEEATDPWAGLTIYDDHRPRRVRRQ